MGLHLGLGRVAGVSVDTKIPMVFVQISASSTASGLAGLAKHFGLGAGALRVCCGTVLCVLKLCLVVPTDS